MGKRSVLQFLLLIMLFVSVLAIVSYAAASSRQVILRSPDDEDIVRTEKADFKYKPRTDAPYQGDEDDPFKWCRLYFDETGYGINDHLKSHSEPKNNSDNIFENIDLDELDLDGETVEWKVICEDNAGQLESLPREFSVNIDLLGPVIDLESPNNGITDTDGKIDFEYTPADSSDVQKCSLVINGSVKKTDTSIDGNETNEFTNIQVGDGQWTWNVNCTDEWGNSNVSEDDRFFEVDTGAATEIQLHSPLDDDRIGDFFVTFNYTPTDEQFEITSCDLLINNSVKESDNTIKNDSVNIFKNVKFNTGSYVWKIRCINEQGNTGTSSKRAFTIFAHYDETPPTITLNSPADKFETSDSVTFKYTPNDDSSEIDSCVLLVDGSVKKTDGAPEKGKQNTFSKVSLSDGAHNWKVKCTDASGNQGLSASRSITIGEPEPINTPPVVDVGGPADNTTVDEISTFTYTPTDAETRIVLCELLVNGTAVATENQITNDVVNSFENVELAKGAYTWKVRCTDLNGGQTSTTEQFIIVGGGFAISASNILLFIIVAVFVALVVLVVLFLTGKLPENIQNALSGKKQKAEKAKDVSSELSAEKQNQLQAFIQQHKGRGVPREHIVAHLKKYKWDDKHIDKAFTQLELTPVQRIQMKQYLKNMMRHGYKEEHIRVHLKKYSYKEEHVNHLFRELHSEETV